MKRVMQTRLNMSRGQWNKRVMQTRLKKDKPKRHKVYVGWRISREALKMLNNSLEELANGYEPKVLDLSQW